MRVVRGADRPLVAASHEDPHNPGVLKRVLLDKADLQLGRVQMVNWALMPAGSRFARHYHEDMQEVFVLVAGVVEMTVAAETLSMARGDTVVIDALEAHQMYNPGPDEAEYLVLGVSAGQGGQTIVVDSQPAPES